MREGVPINGRVLTELRHLAGMEQIDLANAACVHTPGCKVAPNKISDYEREVIKPSAANLNAILKAIRIALEARGLELTPAMLRALYRTDTLNASNGSTGKDDGDEADRRQAGKTILVGGLTAAAFPLEAVERITHHGDRPVDSELITAHENLAGLFADAYCATRPDVFAKPLAAHAHVVHGLLDRPMAASDRDQLQRVTVGVHAEAGMAAFFSGDLRAARRSFATAMLIADDAGDDTLRARALGVTSILHSPVPRGGVGGDTRRSIELLSRAVGCAHRADPFTRAWTRRWLALELAAAGDERGFHTRMEQANRLSDDGDEGGIFAPGVALATQGQVINVASGLVTLGRADDALQVLAEAVAPMLKWRSVVATNTAAAYVLLGEPEQTCAALGTALNYRMDLTRIRGVRARFPEPWAGLPCVQELDERLRLT